MKCEYCEIVERNGKAEILYEDADLVVAIKDMVTTPGQITIFPKEHFTIMELMPENLLKKCSLMANKIGIAVFESLGCQGTNIIVQNGLSAGQKVPHFAIEVIPRREEDGLNLQWVPKEMMEDEIEIVYAQIKEAIEEMGDLTQQKEEPLSSESTDNEDNVDSVEAKKSVDENYLIKSLKRIP